MAERALATAYVTIVPSFKGFESQFNDGIGNKTEGMGRSSGDAFSKGFGSSISKIKNVFMGAVVGGAVANFTSDLIAAGEAEVSSNRKLENITKSMGLFGDHAGEVSKRLEDLSGVQQLQLGIDDDTIKSTQMKLLTFANLAKTAGVAGGMFDRASMAAQDLAAAGFGSAETNAVQLGKALNDPVKGITALARSGVTFTAQEKLKIEQLVKSGKLLDAQNMVLGAIETQVGGTAAAGVTASQKMTQGFNQIKETIGLALLPTFNKVGDYIGKTLIPYIKDFIQRFKDGQTFLNPVWTGIKDFVSFMIKYKDFLLPLLVFVGVIKTAIGIFNLYKTTVALATAAQVAFNVALTANPIGVIIVAIVAVVAALAYFFTKTKTGKAIFAAFVLSVKLGFEYIKGLAIDFANVFVDGLNLIIHAINAFIRAWNMIPGHTDVKTIGTIANIEGGLTTTNNPIANAKNAILATASPKASSQLSHRGTTGTGNTLIYNAAPNNSIDSHKDLVTAVDRTRNRSFR